MSRNPIVQQAVSERGITLRELARLLGITPSAISAWREIPPKRVLEVERITGVPRSRLRPDLYPD